MLQTTKNEFGVGLISHTNIQYSKAQIVGNPDTVPMDQSFRIVLKQDNVKMIDVCNSTICFKLSIAPGDLTHGPLVLAQSAADIFSVTSVYWNGIQLNMLQNQDCGLLYRKIRNKLNGKGARLNQGRVDDAFHTMPCAQSFADAVDAVANQPYSSTLDGNSWNLVSTNQDRNVAVRERLRIASEVQRHYTVTYHATIPTYAAKDGFNYYAVKIGDIMPELKNM